MTTMSEGPTGTFPYIAPEMFTQGHRGTTVDIYALGCVYIELMGQKRVWPKMGGIEIMQKVCGSFNSPPVKPATCHLYSIYREICDICCELDAKKRPKIEWIT